MVRDNFSMLFSAAASPTRASSSSASVSASNSSNSNQGAVVNISQSDNGNHRNRTSGARAARSSSASDIARDETPPISISREATRSDGDLLVGFATSPTTTTSSTIQTPNNANSTTTNAQNSNQPPSSIVQQTKPGTESIQYFKKFGSMALKPLRELQLAEKLHAMNLEIEEIQDEKEVHRQRRRLEENDRQHQPLSNNNNIMSAWGDTNEPISILDQSQSDEQLARELQEQEEEEELCIRIKKEADTACERMGARYDALVKFTNGCPKGTYEEFVEYLLMGGGRTSEAEYDELMFENFYEECSGYRKLWNDNLTLGLPEGVSTLEGRAFVPAVGSSANSNAFSSGDDPWHSTTTPGLSRQRSHSDNNNNDGERLTRNFGQTLRERTFSEGERLKTQIAQADKQRMIKQGLGSAVSAISTVSSFALRPLREMQLAEKLNAMNIDAEDANALKTIEQYNRMVEDDRDMREMMRMKKEAEESCMNATREHLLEFVRDHPDGTYDEWIEDFHPENAHDGTLLEGFGKTIDHRFFVEESDHRRLWNENLFAYLDPDVSGGRKHVPARAKQTNDNGEMVVADDILTGSAVNIGGEWEVASSSQNNTHGGILDGDGGMKSADLIAFD